MTGGPEAIYCASFATHRRGRSAAHGYVRHVGVRGTAQSAALRVPLARPTTVVVVLQEVPRKLKSSRLDRAGMLQQPEPSLFTRHQHAH